MSEFKTTALHYRQGGRDVYSFVMDLEAVRRHLPLRTGDDSGAIKDTNRALVPSHYRKIRDYLDETEDWVMPSITLASTSDNLTFTANGDAGTGTLLVHNEDDDQKTLFRIVDGQHRRHAIQELMGLYETRGLTEEWTTFGEQGLSVTLYAESDPVKIRQMFATMALAKAIDRNTQQQFDSRDPFNNAASYAIENSVLLGKGTRVYRQSATLKRNSDQLLTHSDLKDVAVILSTGLPAKKPTTSVVKFHQKAEEQQKDYERMLTFLDEFLPEAGQAYSDLAENEIDDLMLGLKRQETWLFEPAIIKLIAGCYYKWTQSDDETDALASHLREGIDFNKIAAMGPSAVQEMGVLDAKGRPVRKLAPEWDQAATQICQKARENDR